MKLEQYSINIKKIMTVLIAFFHSFFFIILQFLIKIKKSSVFFILKNQKWFTKLLFN